MKNKVLSTVDTMTQKAARRKGAQPLSDIQASVFNGILSHPVCTAEVQKRIDAAVKESSTEAVRQSIADVWGKLSSPGMVASNFGWPIRRALGAAMAGPGVTFKAARQFCGGSLKQDSFAKAQKRRAEFMAGGAAELLADPKRSKRSDCLEQSCPAALKHIQEFIYNNTQPSPCATVTNHNYAPGNHSRSVADGSLVCNNLDLCEEKEVRYMMGTQLDLYNGAMNDLKAATPSRWLGVLGAAVIAPAVSVSAYHDYSDSSTGCYDLWVGDGYCDSRNNNELCGYDGGDCCSCTCVPPEDSGDDDYACGDSDINPFACIDPNADCVNDDDIAVDMVENCYPGSIGNGYCDHYNNKAVCNDDDITVNMVKNCHDAGRIGNGWCDEENNTPECNYDGGDCCECTCIADEDIDDEHYQCNEQIGYACIDPAAPCVDDDDVTVDMFEKCNSPSGIGNGWCDIGNNIPECNYDGGDCCECTCQFDEDWGYNGNNYCQDFYCVDPEAACVDDDNITVDMLENCPYVFGIGDGYCNDDNNNELCGWDEGDCCYGTCDSGDDLWRCTNASVFNCKDESASCFGEEFPTTTDETTTMTDTYYSMSYEFFDEFATTDTYQYDDSMSYEFFA
eukprot:g5736.t1